MQTLNYIHALLKKCEKHTDKDTKHQRLLFLIIFMNDMISKMEFIFTNKTKDIIKVIIEELFYIAYNLIQESQEDMQKYKKTFKLNIKKTHIEKVKEVVKEL